jgi:hypothetical protein
MILASEQAEHDPSPLSVSVSREGQLIILQPPPEAVLQVLQATRLVACPDNEHGHRVARERRPLFEVWESQGTPPTLRLWAGLWPVASHLLRKAGYEIENQGSHFRPLEEGPALENLAKLGSPDLQLLDFVRHHDRGLVVHGPGVSPARLVAEVALAWPRARITVAVSRIREAYDLRDYLRKYVPEAQAYHSENRPETGARVAVATFDFLDHSPIELAWRDIVLVFSAREAARERVLRLLGPALRARLYGLVPRGERVAPSERDLMAALFGFEEIVVPCYRHRERLVQVASSRFAGGPRPPADLGVLALLQQGLWHHARRNAQVARLAKRLAGQTWAALKGELPGLVPAGDDLEAPRVAVLVESAEHGLALAKRLPGWPLLAGPEVWTEGLSSSQAQRLQAGLKARKAKLKKVIVTATGLGFLGRTDIDVLVRADGGTGLPALSEAHLIERHSQAPRPLLLVDLDDRHHRLLRRRSRQRQEAYLERGWFPVGMAPHHVRAALFLASRR